jgi:hypothetical protein
VARDCGIKMRLKSLINEMTTTANIGTNLIPNRWLMKILKIGSKPDKDKLWFTKQGEQFHGNASRKKRGKK